MTQQQAELFLKLIAEAELLAQQTVTNFGPLTATQLNWQPDATQWSIAQCFEHLLTANQSYFPTFEQILKGEKKTTFWQRVPVLPAIWGKMLVKAVAPETARKLKAPRIYQPASSAIDGDIIRGFVTQQQQLLNYMNAMEGMELANIIIPSPVTNLITYSLMDAYRIIVNHEKRHFQQATRVLRENGFPREEL
jgi:uncharacterized damage-inducible protein DinB